MEINCIRWDNDKEKLVRLTKKNCLKFKGKNSELASPCIQLSKKTENLCCLSST